MLTALTRCCTPPSAKEQCLRIWRRPHGTPATTAADGSIRKVVLSKLKGEIDYCTAATKRSALHLFVYTLSQQGAWETMPENCLPSSSNS